MELIRNNTRPVIANEFALLIADLRKHEAIIRSFYGDTHANQHPFEDFIARGKNGIAFLVVLFGRLTKNEGKVKLVEWPAGNVGIMTATHFFDFDNPTGIEVSRNPETVPKILTGADIEEIVMGSLVVVALFNSLLDTEFKPLGGSEITAFSEFAGPRFSTKLQEYRQEQMLGLPLNLGLSLGQDTDKYMSLNSVRAAMYGAHLSNPLNLKSMVAHNIVQREVEKLRNSEAYPALHQSFIINVDELLGRLVKDCLTTTEVTSDEGEPVVTFNQGYDKIVLNGNTCTVILDLRDFSSPMIASYLFLVGEDHFKQFGPGWITNLEGVPDPTRPKLNVEVDLDHYCYARNKD